MFRFIGEVPKTYELDREDLKAQDIRETMWSGLLQEPTSQLALSILKNTEDGIKTKAQGVALIMPEMKKAAPGETVSVAINLYGPLSVDSMKCKLGISGEGASIESIHSTQALKDQKYKLADMSEAGGSEMSFNIQREAEANPLPAGAIIEANIKVGPTVPTKYTINLDIIETQPAVQVRPVNNVVLVLP